MATIHKRGNSWQVQIRRKGYTLVTKTFSSRADATAWARDKERSIDRAELPITHRELKRLTVADLLSRYEREVTITKRGADRERFKLRVLRAHGIGEATLNEISGAMVARYRDDRLKLVSSGTVRRELAILQHCFEIARREWSVSLTANPVRQIKLPEPSRARERHLTPDETGIFWRAVERARASWVKLFVVLAIETGMRRGELLSIRWQDVDVSRRVARIVRTKNGHERVIPLTSLAIQTLTALPVIGDRVCPLTEVAVRQAWDRLLKRASLCDFRLHGLRHEAVSRFFELGLTAPEVALISGHRDARMLMRYTHLRPETLAQKLEMLGS